MASQPTDNDGEKKVETNAYGEKGFVNVFANEVSHPRYYTDIKHLTAYQNNYATSYYSTITIPPPDLYLQPTV